MSLLDFLLRLIQELRIKWFQVLLWKFYLSDNYNNQKLNENYGQK